MRRGLLWMALIAVPLAAGADEAPAPLATATTTAAEAVSATTGAEAEAARDWRYWLDNEYYKVSLDMRGRVEFADIDAPQFDFSQAWTVRTRLGVGSKPWHGLSAFVEGEGTFSFAPDAYWDVTRNFNGRTPVADPVFIELNRAFAQYANKEMANVLVKGGRQRIIYDDARFIGNVGWRQNEQTYDSARGSTSFTVDGLKLDYAFAWRVHRIFANKGGAGTRDWDSNVNMINLSYNKLEWLNATAFTYLVDLTNDAASQSSNSYGFRLVGKHKLTEKWKVGWTASYAYQTEAAQNPVSYNANYVWGSAEVGYTPIATVGAGYELLGSDDGTARFATPLATAHKFNGFADAFLNNGGLNGLQDFFAYIAPSLPWGVKGRLIYHRFWSDNDSTLLANEFEFVFKKNFSEALYVLAKGAFFWGTERGPADRYRFTMDVGYKF